MKMNILKNGLLVIVLWVFSMVVIASDAIPVTNRPLLSCPNCFHVARQMVEAMTTRQLIGQLTLVDVSMLTDNKLGDAGDGKTPLLYRMLTRYQIGAVYVAGNDRPLHGGRYLLNINNDDPSTFLSSVLHNWMDMAKRIKDNDNVLVQFYFGGKPHTARIQPLLGTDAVHGNQHVIGAVTFPQNIAMAATHNPEAANLEGKYSALSVLHSGFNWIFAPTVGLSHNPQWGRFYETSGVDPWLSSHLVRAYVKGAQQPYASDYLSGVLTTIKHYLGNSATWGGIDEGNTLVVNHNGGMRNFLDTNIMPFVGSILAGAGAIMPGYNAINDSRMTLSGAVLAKNKNKQNLLTVLYKDYGFKGFYVSDQQAVNKANTACVPTILAKGRLQCIAAPNYTYPQAFAKALKSGIAMFMIVGNSTPYKTIPGFMQSVDEALKNHYIDRDDLERAATRVLAVKLAMGLVEIKPAITSIPMRTLANAPSRAAWRKTKAQAYIAALQAAQQSLVLLKNQNNLIPLAKQITNIILVGDKPTWLAGLQQYVVFQSYANLGAQNGGWTVSWQGFNGNTFQSPDGEHSYDQTLLNALHNEQHLHVYYLHYQSGKDSPKAVLRDQKAFINELQRMAKQGIITPANTVIIALLAEDPYAEFMGDVNNPFCAKKLSSTNGCWYNLQFISKGQLNPYMPYRQATSLAIDYSQLDKNIIYKTLPNFPVITILYSGRPRIITQKDSRGHSPWSRSSAFIAAWLPGNAGGQALTNVLLGKYHCKSHRQTIAGKTYYSNTLPAPWPRNMTSLYNYPVYTKDLQGLPKYAKPLFASGYGLSD